MSKIPLERFLILVEQSGLVDLQRLAAVLERWRSEAPPGRWDDAYTCGEHLVAAGLLTEWQCQKLLEGRHRGFRLGNYKLLDHLGSGGMSNVYLAEHVLMQRRVAIKVLPNNRVADSSQLARFHFEGQAVAALDHPNIVRAYDLGHEGRIHYLVMEYIDGSDLAEVVQASGPVNEHAAADYIAQAAAGLEHAHGSGLVHRDIKPANLLVDRHGTVKILDMGLAKFKAEVRPVPAFAREEEVLGTAEYLAPEQAVNSLAVDQRADIYSLGCTLYFLLAGHPPFTGTTAVELVAAHQRDTPRGLLDERPSTPPPLVAICEKMMQKSPDDRYQSASEVREALVGWLQSEREAGRVAPEVAETLAPPASRADKALTGAFTDRLTPPPQPSDSIATRETQLDLRVPDSLPPPPPEPPVVPPPRDSVSAPIPTVKPRVPNPSEAARGAALPVAEAAPFPPRPLPALRVTSARSSALWVWAVLLAVLVVGATLLALFAFAP